MLLDLQIQKIKSNNNNFNDKNDERGDIISTLNSFARIYVYFSDYNGK